MTLHQGYGSKTVKGLGKQTCIVPLFLVSGRNRRQVPGSGSYTRNRDSGLRVWYIFGKTNTVFLPVPPPIPLLLQLLMAFKCGVVVSTIAVKHSNKAAASEAGMNGGQTDSTEFHLGQGEAGKGDSLTDLF